MFPMMRLGPGRTGAVKVLRTFLPSWVNTADKAPPSAPSGLSPRGSQATSDARANGP